MTAQYPAITIGQWMTGGATADVVGRIRDLLVINGGSYRLVVACDSNASVGSKPRDHLAWPARNTGFVATKVPLMEILASGAEPMVVVNNLCVEMNPTGKEILRGVEAACEFLNRMPIITGSDKTNMPTVQTGVGVTVIGIAAPDALRLGRSRPGDAVYAIGAPLGPMNDGSDVFYDEADWNVCRLDAVMSLLDIGFVHEVLPVGSKGLRYEFEQLAEVSGLVMVEEEGHGLDMRRSGGACAVRLGQHRRWCIPSADDRDRPGRAHWPTGTSAADSRV